MTDTELLKTPLYDQHLALGARVVDFGGWALPVNYSSQVEEHHAVRRDAGMFDVSHMTVSDITGRDTLPFLSYLLANDIHKIASTPGKALYSCMLNHDGGVIDDLIVYYLQDDHCRVVTNAATNEKDMAWLLEQAAEFKDVTVTEKPELALIAVQGPKAIEKLTALFSGDTSQNKSHQLLTELKRFQGGFGNGELFIGRTGYTGEDGVEIILPGDQAVELWQALVNIGIKPCGLGARDTLRLEAGMALYGSDLDEQHTPIDCGLSWAVAMKDDRRFIGRAALEGDAQYKAIGLVLEGRGVMRGHQSVYLDGELIGETTSGTFSPTFEKSIAMARVQKNAKTELGGLVQVEIRQKMIDARVVKYPFKGNL